MRTHFLVIGLFLLLLITGSCSSGNIGVKATGLTYEVVVVMNRDYWKSDIGEAIRADLASAVPGLPQEEPSMKITYVEPKDFNGLLTYVRNIFILNIDPAIYTKTSLVIEKDRWAKGQDVITMNTPSRESVLEYTKEHERILVDYFVKVEMQRAVAQLEKDYSPLVYNKLKEKFDISFKAPDNMTFYRDTTGFFWASNNANLGRTDLIVYTFPYTDPNTFTMDFLIAKRDSVLKVNLPGAFPNSYMATETRIPTVTYKALTINGKYTGVLRGLWRMVGDQMGGPFISHAYLDEVNNRVVVVEGFVFAPETTKRNYIRRIEAALYTLHLLGETTSEK